MKSLYTSIAVISVALALGDTAAGRSRDLGSPQAPAQRSAPTVLRLDGELKTPEGGPRTGTVVMVASLYAGSDDPIPLWVEHQQITLDQAGRYTMMVGATLEDGVPKEFFLSGNAGSGLWLGIAVQDEAEQPRVMLVSVPYALKAREADLLDGRAATDFVLNEDLDDSVKSALKAAGPNGTEAGILAQTPGRLAKFSSAGNGAVEDSSFFDLDGRLGLGVESPSGLLHLAKDADSIEYISAAGTGVNAALIPRRSRGTHAAPTDVANGDLLFQFAAQAYSGSSFFDTADFRMVVDGGVTSGQRPASRFEFYTNTSNGAATERMRIDSAGNVGIGTTAPSGRLHIARDGDAIAFISAAGAGANAALIPRRSRGTHAAPSNVASGDLMFQFAAQAYAGGFFDTADFRMVVDGAVTSGERPASRFEFYTNAANGAVVERMRIDSAGNIGIGTTNPTSKLHVAGNALVTGDVTVDGNIAAKYQDVAEWVETPDPLESGTVVIVDPVEPNRVVASSKAYDTRVAGAVSAQPGLILGERSDSKAMVAQSGRVRIKVDASHGAIKIGDLLVTSGTPGYAMLSKPLRIGGHALHRPGTLLGKALEALPKGKGEILVLLTLQ